MNLIILKKQPPEVFFKKCVLKNFVVLTGKHLCWNLFTDLQFCNFVWKRHQILCFPLNIAKLLRTPDLKHMCAQLLLILWKRIDTAEDLTTQAKRIYINWNLWVFNFLEWITYKEKFKENPHKSKQMQGGTLSHLAGTKFNFHM